MLTAVDAAIMVIDAGKGIESADAQAVRGLPPARHPDLHLHEQAGPPARGPAGAAGRTGERPGHRRFPDELAARHRLEFRGRVRPAGQGRCTSSSARRAAPTARPVAVGGLDRSASSASDWTPARLRARRRGTRDARRRGRRRSTTTPVLAGRLTPVFFGSAVNNFGVQLLLDGFLEHRRAARAARSRRHRDRARNTRAFSGFVFKIQANMDPRHRDRIAFLRVCSGKFERDMTVIHAAHRQEGPAVATRTSSSGRSARRWTRPIPATSSASSATPASASATR